MFLHYLKIAFRNMRKYKNQTLVSVVGLAVGFTCFALATLWIRYEMTFDSFYKNAGQMYVVYRPRPSDPAGASNYRRHPDPLAAYLKETFPEIANATSLYPPIPSLDAVAVEDVEFFQILIISADSSFFRMFDVKILEGNSDFLIPGNYSKVAITQEKAKQLFGNENPIGRKIQLFDTYFGRDDNNLYQEICAVVSGMPKQSNYPFEFIRPQSAPHPDPSVDWRAWMPHTIIELFPGINIEAFEKKLYEHNTGEGKANISRMTIKPLTKIRYTDPEIRREVKFEYISIFALSGLLVVLCSLFNYLALFVSRFRIRQKELALRVVCGASDDSLLTMLSVEFLLTLLFSVLLGCIMTQWVHKPFLKMSEIQMNLPAIYSEMFVYIGSVILVTLLVFWTILFIFRRRTLNLSIRRSNKKIFRKVSVVAQLVISIGIAFCTIIIMKQMYFLHHSGELGFSFKNRGSVIVFGGNADVLAHQLKLIPEIIEVVDARGLTDLLPEGRGVKREISSWDDQFADGKKIELDMMYVSPEFINFYDLQLLAGEMLTNADPDSVVMLNETAVREFGWHDPVGKKFADGRFTVKGVIKNVYNFPTIEAKPVCYLKPWPERESAMMRIRGTTMYGRSVLFKYHEGMWKSCIKKIEKLKNDFHIDAIYHAEEIFEDNLKSENALLKLLSFVSAICVLICVFGFVSLISLTCEERRKEIAIRKINGATSGDILSIFTKEYFLLLIIGAAIAFPAGYFIMQRWLEQYVKQTNIPAWIYLSIICVMALIIVLCVGWRVYKASIENPAEVVKAD